MGKYALTDSSCLENRMVEAGRAGQVPMECYILAYNSRPHFRTNPSYQILKSGSSYSLFDPTTGHSFIKSQLRNKILPTNTLTAVKVLFEPVRSSVHDSHSLRILFRTAAMRYLNV